MTTQEFLNKMLETRRENEFGLEDVGLGEAAKRAGLQGVRDIPTGAILRSHASAISRLTNPMESLQMPRHNALSKLAAELEVEIDRRLGAPRIAKEDRR